jgi:hypothetical protein
MDGVEVVQRVPPRATSRAHAPALRHRAVGELAHLELDLVGLTVIGSLRLRLQCLGVRSVNDCGSQSCLSRTSFKCGPAPWPCNGTPHITNTSAKACLSSRSAAKPQHRDHRHSAIHLESHRRHPSGRRPRSSRRSRCQADTAVRCGWRRLVAPSTAVVHVAFSTHQGSGCSQPDCTAV